MSSFCVWQLIRCPFVIFKPNLFIFYQYSSRSHLNQKTTSKHLEPTYGINFKNRSGQNKWQGLDRNLLQVSNPFQQIFAQSLALKSSLKCTIFCHKPKAKNSALKSCPSAPDSCLQRNLCPKASQSTNCLLKTLREFN